MWFTCPTPCGPLSFIKKELIHKNKIEKEYKNHAARLLVRCSAVFILKQCGRLYDVVHPVSATKLLWKQKKVMRFTS